jgi:two-component system sensor histidine kinase RpfC
MMSKLEAGAESTEWRPFNLWYFLQQLTAIVRPQSTAKGLAWHLHVDAEVPPMVVGDQGHLGHALGNLLNNAFKFTSHGSVTLRVLKAGADSVRFEVTDTGIGIPLEYQERLFERFVQVDTSTTRRHGGTGLGTSIARDLVELMGGRIGVVSAPGKGSTFWIEVPLAKCLRNTSLQEWQSTPKALIVGSKTSQLEELVTTVQTLGFDTAVRGKEIQQDASAFDAEQYFVAVLVMEAAAAATYADAVIRGRGGAVCPWIVLSPEYSDAQRAVLIRCGVAAVLPYPCARDDLSSVFACLQNRIEQRTAITHSTANAQGIVRPLNIVLADDNRSNQVLLSRILRDAGHTVTTAQSGAEAFDLMGTSGRDIALLDLNMPDMSGPDVVKLFRASSVGADKLPIIILSADATASAKRESLEAGADDFLTKPIGAAELLKSIERVVAGVAQRDIALEAQRESESPQAAPALTFVDAERIHALRRIARGDAKFLDQYTSAAFTELEQAISDLRLASASGDERAARDALHIIEGTGASIGASALVANCKSVRNYFAVPNDPERGGALAEISTTYTLTKSTVLASLHHARDHAIGGRAQGG